jgi:hypothetical protein
MELIQMNDRQLELFANLKHLAATTEVFLTRTHNFEDKIYRVFDYRLARYSDFLLPDARESRGIMFEVDAQDNPIRLACWMPSKFFNLNENPLTIGLDLSDDNIDGVMDKLDGSIISTMMHNGRMILKSKTSLTSDHVAQATEHLTKQSHLREKLEYFTAKGYSVHMELTSPDLRIVLGYPEVKLTILSMRRLEDGAMVSKRNYYDHFPSEFRDDGTDYYWVKEFGPDHFVDNPFTDPLTLKRVASVFNGTAETNKVSEFVDSIKAMTGVEGYIVRLKNGEHIKIKCDWYCALHHTKDSISAPRRLFECILNGAADDLKAMFAVDPITIARITEMETKVVAKFNSLVAKVENFYETNKGMDRKTYAITASADRTDGLMGLKMALYIGQSNNYTEFFLKHPEMFEVNVAEVEEVA